MIGYMCIKASGIKSSTGGLVDSTDINFKLGKTYEFKYKEVGFYLNDDVGSWKGTANHIYTVEYDEKDIIYTYLHGAVVVTKIKILKID